MYINQMFIPKFKSHQRSQLHMAPKYITIHSTGNPSSYAKGEASYACNRNDGRSVSYHFVVDEKTIIQIIPTNEVAWHAGDGGKGVGNRQSIGIEMCETGDREIVINNTIWLVKKLMDEFNIPIANIVQHNHWSGKDCPRILRNPLYIKNGIDWEYFIKLLKKADDGDEMVKPKIINLFGKDVSVDSIFKEDKNYVSLREVFEKTGFKVTVREDGTPVIAFKDVNLSYKGVDVALSGSNINGTNYVSLREMVGLLKHKVDWKDNKVIIE